MKTALIIFHIILSISVIVLIFLQASGDTDGRGNILSTTAYQKRGWEKVIFNFTIFILVLFLLSSLVQSII